MLEFLQTRKWWQWTLIGVWFAILFGVFGFWLEEWLIVFVQIPIFIAGVWFSYKDA